MKTEIGKNIQRLRKEKGYTQKDLAELLQVSAQAISKWENGQSYPDVEILPDLTDILMTNIDTLFGHIPGDIKKASFQDIYKDDDYYWGLQPNDLCIEIIKMFPADHHIKLLDVGCGEGKDALFFARNGYDVTAFDIAQSGIDKLYRLADRFRVPVKAFKADMMEYRCQEDFDIIYSSRSMQYIRPEVRKEIITDYQTHTKTNGINAFNVFVEKPFIPDPPDQDDYVFLWNSGELFLYYRDWKLLSIDEMTYDCYSSNIYHQHTVDIMVAQKI